MKKNIIIGLVCVCILSIFCLGASQVCQVKLSVGEEIQKNKDSRAIEMTIPASIPIRLEFDNPIGGCSGQSEKLVIEGNIDAVAYISYDPATGKKVVKLQKIDYNISVSGKEVMIKKI